MEDLWARRLSLHRRPGQSWADAEIDRNRGESSNMFKKTTVAPWFEPIELSHIFEAAPMMSPPENLTDLVRYV
jgi:hypothetical protein